MMIPSRSKRTLLSDDINQETSKHTALQKNKKRRLEEKEQNGGDCQVRTWDKRAGEEPLVMRTLSRAFYDDPGLSWLRRQYETGWRRYIPHISEMPEGWPGTAESDGGFRVEHITPDYWLSDLYKGPRDKYGYLHGVRCTETEEVERRIAQGKDMMNSNHLHNDKAPKTGGHEGPHDGFEPTGYDEERPPAPVDQPDQPMSIPWRLMRILQNNRHWPDGEGLDLSEDCVENTTS